MSAEEAGRPSSVLGKAQLLLGAFESGAYQLGLTELSRRSGVPKASAYRLAQELVEWGLLERRGECYQLGLRMFELGQRVPASAVLRAVARPALADLFAATRATIHLAVLDGVHVLFLEKVAGEANIHSHSRIGGRLPAPGTATGKVLLATAPDPDERLARLREAGLTHLTSRTVSSVDDLRKQLTVVRAKGFALEIEETMPGVGSLAVPVTGADGTVHAAVSTTAPVARLVPRRLLPELRTAAATIARALDRALLTASEVRNEPFAAAPVKRAAG
ncbi:IclR family transcriptional regulator [Amycolatopsis australiensis]|uniref:DNA-binding transcriptional regulator, IclR family n=1 Tax=Amycolatopsis australiensis TaxID=546364 RepID=A0A1K1S3B7_9PSEU|nr:IclR family transcriptional regulator [Amycolatopsis australiensis]SFW78588.1 DNA-binding transcriptional regulator, IclR family [Amycolatopsis australiensis]